MLRQLCSRSLQSLASLQGRCTSGLATTLRAASSLSELSRPAPSVATSQSLAWSYRNSKLLAAPALGLGLAPQVCVTPDASTILSLFVSQRRNAAAAAAAAAVKKAAPAKKKKKKSAPKTAASSKPKPKPKSTAAAATKGRVRTKPAKAPARKSTTTAAAKRKKPARNSISAAGRKAAKAAEVKARLRVRATAQRARARAAKALAMKRERAKLARIRRREREALRKQKQREKLAAAKARAKEKEAARIKKAPSAFGLYLQDHSKAVRDALPAGAASGMQRQALAFKVLAERFKVLPEAEKAPYEARSAALKAKVAEARAQAKAENSAKAALTPYILFFKESYSATRAAHPDLNAKQVAAKMGQLWKAMPAEQQQRYRDLSEADRKAKGLPELKKKAAAQAQAKRA